jgi:predicted RNA polymerase sigma factor
MELGRHDAALARIDALAKTSAAPNPIWVARRGDILAKAGRREAARVEYARALDLIAQRAPARNGKPLADLKQKLETALASVEGKGGTQ